MVKIVSRPATPRVDMSLEAPFVLLEACDPAGGADDPDAALVVFPDALAAACKCKVKTRKAS